MQESVQALNGINTSGSQDNPPQSANTKSHILLLTLFYLTSRCVFSFLNEAEFTDAYILFNWSWSTSQKWHPLYPVLIRLFSAVIPDQIFAGRIVSILCGGAAVIALWKLTATIYDSRTAFLSALLLIASPQFLWANTRVLTESLFIAISIATILFSYRALCKNKLRDSLFAIFFSGLAILTRPDGLILLPCALWSIVRALQYQKDRLRYLLSILPALSSWIVFLIWVLGRNPQTTYEGELAFSLQNLSISKALLYFATYLENYPFSLTYPVFLAALLSIFLAPSKNTRHVWLIILAYLHMAVFGIITIHWAWSSRFLILSLVLVLPECASFLVSLKTRLLPRTWRIVSTGVISISLMFAFVGTYLQKDTYKDVKNSAEFIRKNFPNTKVYSDEKIKVPFYLHRGITFYSQQESFQAGEILVLHSFHTPLQWELKRLSELYNLRVLYVSRARTMPLLCNSLLENFASNGFPIIVLKRFEWQRFESIVIQFGKRKSS